MLRYASSKSGLTRYIAVSLLFSILMASAFQVLARPHRYATSNDDDDDDIVEESVETPSNAKQVNDGYEDNEPGKCK